MLGGKRLVTGGEGGGERNEAKNWEGENWVWQHGETRKGGEKREA